MVKQFQIHIITFAQLDYLTHSKYYNMSRKVSKKKSSTKKESRKSNIAVGLEVGLQEYKQRRKGYLLCFFLVLIITAKTLGLIGEITLTRETPSETPMQLEQEVCYESGNLEQLRNQEWLGQDKQSDIQLFEYSDGGEKSEAYQRGGGDQEDQSEHQSDREQDVRRRNRFQQRVAERQESEKPRKWRIVELDLDKAQEMDSEKFYQQIQRVDKEDR